MYTYMHILKREKKNLNQRYPFIVMVKACLNGASGFPMYVRQYSLVILSLQVVFCIRLRQLFLWPTLFQIQIEEYLVALPKPIESPHLVVYNRYQVIINHSIIKKLKKTMITLSVQDAS
mmetsp:Transcript_18992/g.23278  ORF Transcript_18992/g.23278 Transcript_18992/m.23278 type:complete len:119 (-) Transcript_18992:317-673(-)